VLPPSPTCVGVLPVTLDRATTPSRAWIEPSQVTSVAAGQAASSCEVPAARARA
jgi:hypothetical protein